MLKARATRASPNAVDDGGEAAISSRERVGDDRRRCCAAAAQEGLKEQEQGHGASVPAVDLDDARLEVLRAVGEKVKTRQRRVTG